MGKSYKANNKYERYRKFSEKKPKKNKQRDNNFQRPFNETSEWTESFIVGR